MPRVETSMTGYRRTIISESSNRKERETKVEELLTRGVVEVADMDHLRQRLLSGEILRVKLGIDPTGNRIHLGRGATLLKLKDFQDLGNKIVLIIGDGTAQVGDSSDKKGSRSGLTAEEIERNVHDYETQIGKVLDMSKVEIRHNADWLRSLPFEILLKLGNLMTLQEVVSRENFALRIRDGNPVFFREAMYALFQGYDSVMVQADVEIGGSDQTFNLTKGRDVQRAFDQLAQDYLTTQLLAGIDGEKMSTSLGNCIWITDSPEVKFRQLMRLSDHLISVYLECATRIPMERVHQIDGVLEGGTGDPVALKKELAHEIVRIYDGVEAADTAQKYFEQVVQRIEIPKSIPTIEIDSDQILIKDLYDLMMQRNLGKSKSALKRLTEQGGVYVNGEPLLTSSEELDLTKGEVTIRVGKRGLGMIRILGKKTVNS